MFSKLKRIGTTAFKVQITIELKRLTILEAKDCRSGLFIEFERGSKAVRSTSRDSQSDSVETKLILQYDETLTLVMTLYKDSAGKYIEKKGKLVLKGLSKVTGKEVKLGSVKLSLHTLADDYEKKNMQLQFEDVKGRPMGLIDVSTTSKYLGDATAGDDDSSVVSGTSRSTFSSASHMDVIQGLGGSVAVNPYKRDRIGRFEELEAKASLAIKADFQKHHSNDESTHPKAPSLPSPNDSNKKAFEFTRQNLTAIKEQNEKDNFNQDSASPVFKKNEKTYVDSSNNPFSDSVKSSKDGDESEIQSLRAQLKEVKRYQIAMEEEFQSKITSMIERIIEIEDESDLDHYNHEQEIIKILKAGGIYHKAGANLRDADNNLTYTDEWADLFREQVDEERIKVMALKKCLIKFASELSSQDNQDLLEAGIALSAARSKR
jgi:hypothetical protein